MSSRGDACDNAMAERFFATLECELLAKHRFRSHTDARLALFRYIEGWYIRTDGTPPSVSASPSRSNGPTR